MWSLPLDNLDPALRTTGAAALSAVLAHSLSSRQWELESEALAWIILPVLFKARRSIGLKKGSPSTDQTSIPSRSALWVIATGITISSFCRAENNLSASLAALTPLILVSREEEPDSLDKCPSRIQHPTKIQWQTICSILFAVLTLAKWQIRGVALAAAPASLLFALHVALSYRTSKSNQGHDNNTLEDPINYLSSHVMAMLATVLCVQCYRFGFSDCDVVSLLSIALAKAIFWYFALQSTRYITWSIVPLFDVFALCSTQSPSMQHSEVQAVSQVGASFAALIQLIDAISKQSRLRSALWLLLLIPVYPYLVNVTTIREMQSAAERFSIHQQHPIEAIAHHGRQKYAELTTKQSKTYKKAFDEYRRRYRIDPPPGFQDWYEFATSHQSPIIDNYDMIHESVSPFWKQSGKEFLQTMQQARKITNGELWTCDFTTTSSQTKCTHPSRLNERHFGLLFNNMLEKLHVKLPNMTVLINHLDEPRVLLPPLSSTSGTLNGGHSVNMTDLSSRSTWEEVTKYCGNRKRDMANIGMKTSLKTLGLPFITDPIAAIDLCEHPEYKSMHGLLTSPVSFKLFEGLAPVLSTGALSTMGDILFPSPAYIESDFEYNEPDDIDWERKQNNLYWAGSNTGGYANDEQWQSFHRQRFVTFAQNLGGKHQRFYYLRSVNDVVSLVRSWFLNGRLLDVAFSRIFGCDAKYCREQSLYFNTRAWAHKNEAFRSRLVFDLDGNGISGRYYKLLASKSTPLKQTLLREWHDERLIPWVHYVPVSQSMEELPELITHLTSTRSGQQRARQIAEQGREWHSKALREIDLGIYNYRLLLELARLQDLTREAIS